MSLYCKLLFIAVLLFFSVSGHGSVILQYHHVSEETPASTSISPVQFEAHMQYLADNGFTVISLSELMNTVLKQAPLKDKTIVITFDDAYLDILINAKPILDKFNYPFTIFINPGIVERGSSNYLSWAQLKAMSDDGVIIANHGLEHDSLARLTYGKEDWQEKLTEDLLKAEKMIADNTGQNWQYFAYPYGEFTPEIQHWIKETGFIAFGQQSGAVGLATDLTNVPRFPVSKPYDKITSLKDKLYSLPFLVSAEDHTDKTIYRYDELKEVTLNITVDDFHQSQLNCYVTGIGKQTINWLNKESLTITFNKPLPVGRVRSNCTAPSISQPGRYYWYSKPWFILNSSGEWYPH
ncbi:polysaccharide deacetylase family protein [Thalassotalea ganghwensis]